MSPLGLNMSPLSSREADLMTRYCIYRWMEVHESFPKAKAELLEAADIAKRAGNTLDAMVALHSLGVLAYEMEEWAISQRAFEGLRDLAHSAGHHLCEGLALMWLAKLTTAARQGHGKAEYEQAASVFESIGEVDQAQACRDAGSDSFWESMTQLQHPAESETNPEDEIDE